MASIDLDRGVIQRFTADGGCITMYKDSPGTYWSELGMPVSAEVAKSAGFDVDKDRLEQKRQQLMREKQKEVERELRRYKSEVKEDQAVAVGSESDDSESKNYYVRHKGGGRFAIFRRSDDEQLDGLFSPGEVKKKLEDLEAAADGA